MNRLLEASPVVKAVCKDSAKCARAVRDALPHFERRTPSISGSSTPTSLGSSSDLSASIIALGGDADSLDPKVISHAAAWLRSLVSVEQEQHQSDARNTDPGVQGVRRKLWSILRHAWTGVQAKARPDLHKQTGSSTRALGGVQRRDYRLTPASIRLHMQAAFKLVSDNKFHDLMNLAERIKRDDGCRTALEDRLVKWAATPTGMEWFKTVVGLAQPDISVPIVKEYLKAFAETIPQETIDRYQRRPLMALKIQLQMLAFFKTSYNAALEDIRHGMTDAEKACYDTEMHAFRKEMRALSKGPAAPEKNGITDLAGSRQERVNILHKRIAAMFVQLLRGMYEEHELRGQNSYRDAVNGLLNTVDCDDVLLDFLNGMHQSGYAELTAWVMGSSVTGGVAHVLPIFRECLLERRQAKAAAINGQIRGEVRGPTRGMARYSGGPPGAVALPIGIDADVVEQIRHMGRPAKDKVASAKALFTHWLEGLVYPLRWDLDAKEAWRTEHFQRKFQDRVRAFVRIDRYSTDAQIAAAYNDMVRALVVQKASQMRLNEPGFDMEIELRLALKDEVARLRGSQAAGLYGLLGEAARPPTMKFKAPRNRIMKALFALREWWRNPYGHAVDLQAAGAHVDETLLAPNRSWVYLRQLLKSEPFVRKNLGPIQEAVHACLRNDQTERFEKLKSLINVRSAVGKADDIIVPDQMFLEALRRESRTVVEGYLHKWCTHAATRHMAVKSLCGEAGPNENEQWQLGFWMKALSCQAHEVLHARNRAIGVLLGETAEPQ
ncbi:hypothetical protein [Bordetella sp. N]|uniref:hypothetical protein n=1 Tax=Bordetella sp. N TaxID=1746199 RepID=UPI00070FBCBD|nr:hypothetical protein [Bordetella sp. N]ALM85385.1 hypothetical protein ASB57_22580 [Bordetella sp. N]